MQLNNNQLVMIQEEAIKVPLNINVNELTKNGEAYAIDLVSCVTLADNKKADVCKDDETEEIMLDSTNTVFDDYIVIEYIDDYVETVKIDGCFNKWF